MNTADSRNFCPLRLRQLSLSFFLLSIALLLVTPSPASGIPQDDKADLVLLGGSVVTVDKNIPSAEAVAVKGDRILKVGTDDEIRKLVDTATKVVQLDGELVIPGLIEGHGHFMGVGDSKMMLDLSTAKSWDDIIEMVETAARSTPPGDWIIGRGWHQEKWSKTPQPNVDGYPDHQALSRVSPNHPVLLTHASGHMCFANGYAMRESRIDNDTKDPKGGEILRNEDGQAIGIFRETAAGLIGMARMRSSRSATPESRSKRQAEALRLAQLECLKNGITSFQDAGSSFSTISKFKSMADNGELDVRLYVMVRDGNLTAERLEKARTVGHGNHFLTVRGIKHSIDGALGPHGAWLLLPYDDLPSSAGLNTTRIETIEKSARLAVECEYQLCIHAIGDRANREVLDIFESAFENSKSHSGRRWRIEHAQHLHPDDIGRFAELGVIASMQGIHCTSDAIYVPTRLGMRRSQQGAYVWQSLLKSGAIICNGTDAPVENINPIACFYASVTRRLENGITFFPEQCMTREQALRSYTLDAAYAAFEDQLKGSITRGKLADITVLSKNIMTCPEEEIRDAKAVYTIVGGQIKYALKDQENGQDESDDDVKKQIESLIPLATAMKRDDFDALAVSPSLDKSLITWPSLTARLMFTPISDDKEKMAEFRYEGTTPDPAKVASEMRRGGMVTMIHKNRVTEVTCKVKGERASGSVSFSVPGMYSGKFQYVALLKDDEWLITELSMPAYQIRLTRDKKGKWTEEE